MNNMPKIIYLMTGCYPRPCDHHCARVCRQYICNCDYHLGYTNNPEEQRICCTWEIAHKPKSNHYAYSDQDAQEDTLTRYFGIDRSFREPHDPVRFTGVNHIPRWLHADLSSLDTNYSNLLKEREIMAACRYSGPGGYYTYKSIRPYNQIYDDRIQEKPRMCQQDVEDARSGVQKGRITAQGLRCGQMPFLE